MSDISNSRRYTGQIAIVTNPGEAVKWRTCPAPWTIGAAATADQLFDALPGDWSLSRIIRGHGTMTGAARFQPHRPGVLRYREEGVFRPLSGIAVRATREHFYVREPDGIRVTFAAAGEPGATLHRLRLGDALPAEACDVHLCGGDVYEGRYRFEGGRLEITMVVRGPAKDMVIDSTLERVGGQSAAPDRASGGGER